METTSTPDSPVLYTWMITLQFPVRLGFGAVTETGHFPVQPDKPASRMAAYREIRALMARTYPETTGATLLFFSLEPDRL
ncbi:hypothetical protein ACFVVL_22100 [Kitasatospora sp. NPDC058115]|uniref:hypothetical protein n=1 Tax=Kitasatospora sp. NPDC058115 TaxID=3346347 RepID=UPI0036DF1703